MGFNIAPYLLVNATQIKLALSSREITVKVVATNSLRAVSADMELLLIIEDPEAPSLARATGFFVGVVCGAIVLSLTLTGSRIFKLLQRQ